MKRIVCWLALLVFSSALWSTGLSEDAVTVGIAQVTTEKGTLNLRKKPDDKATVLERIPNHSLVRVLSDGDQYWQIQYESTIGYAVCSYLTMTDYTEDVLNYRLLYRNNTGDDVLAVKERLLELGYYREGSKMNNVYNETCVERVKMFQRQNGMKEDGIASSALQAALFATSAVVNTETLPKAVASSYVLSSSSDSSDGSGNTDDIDWAQWMLDNPGVCPCCMGRGCACCNWTGQI
jgi:murein L,D-transpeptidase YcbB/YkuD